MWNLPECSGRCAHFGALCQNVHCEWMQCNQRTVTITATNSIKRWRIIAHQYKWINWFVVDLLPDWYGQLYCISWQNGRGQHITFGGHILPICKLTKKKKNLWKKTHTIPHHKFYYIFVIARVNKCFCIGSVCLVVSLCSFVDQSHHCVRHTIMFLHKRYVERWLCMPLAGE